MILTCRIGSSKSGAQRVLSLRPPPSERRYCLQFLGKMYDSDMPDGFMCQLVRFMCRMCVCVKWLNDYFIYWFIVVA